MYVLSFCLLLCTSSNSRRSASGAHNIADTVLWFFRIGVRYPGHSGLLITVSNLASAGYPMMRLVTLDQFSSGQSNSHSRSGSMEIYGMNTAMHQQEDCITNRSDIHRPCLQGWWLVYVQRRRLDHDRASSHTARQPSSLCLGRTSTSPAGLSEDCNGRYLSSKGCCQVQRSFQYCNA